ncbi:MAG: DUF4982 domain-containing protein [Ruminococcus sp.]|nr:DUF4982 domain-containing protein [Ruminococcus sp.]
MIKTLFCDKWEFSKNPIGTEYENASGWRRTALPHDWLIWDTTDLYETSTGWYRRTVTLPDDGMRTMLRFEGVYMDCRVYVNGSLAGEWKYGYTTFGFDISDLLHSGENLIAVRVDHRSPNSRWYSGAGIFRNVWLCRYPDTHILPDGIYITAGTDGTVYITAETERPEGESVEGLSLKTEICKRGGQGPAAYAESLCCAADRSALPDTVTRSGCAYSVTTQTVKINSPALWDIDDPQLYTCTVTLCKDGVPIDRESVTFGFRSAEFTTDHGFLLNGRRVKLHGCCEHHDLGALGAAVNRSALRRQLEILRGMGVNAIRTSHNPPAVELMELADEMGFLILSEGFDMWELKKTDYDYARFFPEWVERDVASWVRRDRCHPSLIGWSIGNEIYDTHVSERGQEVTSLLSRLVRLHDPRGNGSVTIGSNYMSSDNAQRCADILKIAGYNYAERLYDEHHAAHPDWCIYGSETSSVVQSRGIYHFPRDIAILSDDDEQCSSLGNSAPIWAAKSWEACIIPDRDREYCAGQFIWTGFDYIGEPTPYSTKNSYFGQIDTAGFPKDSYYVFKSVWEDGKGEPFIHIFPYWDFNEGQVIDIRVASNCPKVKLMFNGEVIAEKDFDPQHDTELTLDTKLTYSKGEIKALGFDESGRQIACESVPTHGSTAKLKLNVDPVGNGGRDKNSLFPADGETLIFVDISAADENGVFSANAADRVMVEVTGEGRLIGLDNGDSTDYEQYKGVSRRLFSGRLLAMIAPDTEAGEISVKVSSPALPDAFLTLHTAAAEVREGIALPDPCTPRPLCVENAESDIPVRKIELHGEKVHFDPEHRELTFSVRAIPENSSCADDIEFKLITAAGIVTHNARVKSASHGSVTVECMGDGEFLLRALCKNGTDRYHVISDLPLTADGIGSALIDPYELVAGGLYSVSGGNVTTGIHHGAGIANGGGWFGFENVDLGEVGSDVITVPLFANYNTPVRIKIWDGIPDNGGELLGDFEYALAPKWLTYQPMSYKLPKVLTGVHTICIQSDTAYDVQGFRFEKRAKETSELFAANAESIYGDRFTKQADAVTGIGNNVTVSFGDFDFAAPPERVCICGRSELPVNSIHIVFEGSCGEIRTLAEFSQAADYTERSFPVEGICGKGKVSLIFLPGCDFDLRSVRFE